MSDRDPVIHSALDDVEVPPYAPGFWDRLEARLEREQTGHSSAAPVGDRAHTTHSAPELVEVGTVSEPSLGPSLSPRRPERLRFAAAAAVIVVVVLTVQLRSGVDNVQTTSPTEGTAPTATTAAPEGAPTPLRAPTAADTVVAWIDAIGAGDVDEAIRLTGPRTVAYFEALGGNMPGVVVEWGEAYGAWSDVGDRVTEVVPLGEVEGHAVAVVLVSGTWRGDGEEGYRTEAIAVVERADGVWSAEPAAFDPERGGRLEVTSPPPGEAGPGGIGPDGVIEVVSRGQGTYYFAIDGAEATAVPSGAEGSRVRFDPPGSLSDGTHRLLIAQVDEDNITAQALTFVVEG